MLRGMVKPIGEYTRQEIAVMYSLMAEFYDNTDEAVFRRDFFDKDYCLALYHDEDGLVGFIATAGENQYWVTTADEFQAATGISDQEKEQMFHCNSSAWLLPSLP